VEPIVLGSRRGRGRRGEGARRGEPTRCGGVGRRRPGVDFWTKDRGDAAGPEPVQNRRSGLWWSPGAFIDAILVFNLARPVDSTSWLFAAPAILVALAHDVAAGAGKGAPQLRTALTQSRHLPPPSATPRHSA
jgi:hypothetical protein